MSIIIYFAAVVCVVGVMLLSYFLGQRHNERATDSPYESGILETGSARIRFDAQFYLIAAFFVVFDVESVFIFTWSVAAKTLGVQSLIHISIFIALLLIALLYLWRIGALSVMNPQPAPSALPALPALPREIKQ
jgi:NADH-quinone oxidoreductase subunit A